MSKSVVKCYTVPEAARAMRCTLKYIYDLLYSGKMGATKAAGRWRIPESEVNARIAKRGEKSAPKFRCYLILSKLRNIVASLFIP